MARKRSDEFNAKKEAFEYLNLHKNVIIDMQPRQIILTLIDLLGGCPYSTASSYFREWKREELGIENNQRNNKLLSVPEPSLQKYGENCLIGSNGEYKIHKNGLLLENKKGYLNLGSKKECLAFFNEILVAYEELGIDA